MVAGELIMGGGFASQRTSLRLKLIHGHSGQSGGLVMLGGMVVNFVNWLCVVDNVVMMGILLDDRLNSLNDVMVYVFPDSSRCCRLGDLGGHNVLTISELLLLGGKTPLEPRTIPMVELAFFDGMGLVLMSLRPDLLMLDRLQGSVVMSLSTNRQSRFSSTEGDG